MATKRISGGHTSVGAMPRSYQVTPVVLRRRRATEPKQVRPNGRQAKRESARRRRETYRHGRTSPTTPQTMTLRLDPAPFTDSAASSGCDSRRTCVAHRPRPRRSGGQARYLTEVRPTPRPREAHLVLSAACALAGPSAAAGREALHWLPPRASSSSSAGHSRNGSRPSSSESSSKRPHRPQPARGRLQSDQSAALSAARRGSPVWRWPVMDKLRLGLERARPLLSAARVVSTVLAWGGVPLTTSRR